MPMTSQHHLFGFKLFVFNPWFIPLFFGVILNGLKQEMSRCWKHVMSTKQKSPYLIHSVLLVILLLTSHVKHAYLELKGDNWFENIHYLHR